MYVICVELEINPSHREAFMRAMLANAQASLNDEPACTQFDVCVRNDNANCVFLYERYDSAADFQLHLKTPHFLEFDKLVAPWVQKKTVTAWTQVNR
ncbi:MAG: antibiotic biosynthesis monooxygenase [Betaproteobacteria bacterium]|nr:MAG: antibiotic biosynthesis monooxygenase [Betaproteobacteria bacterium]